jgi:hypothetical protein
VLIGIFDTDVGQGLGINFCRDLPLSDQFYHIIGTEPVAYWFWKVDGL